MLADGLTLIEGSSFQNLTVASGATLPASPDIGEVFYLTSGTVGLHVYNGSGWDQVGGGSSLAGFGITASSTEINYLTGVSSNVQTQLNGKQASGSYLTSISSGDVTTALTFTPLNKAGDTFTGNITSNGTAKVTGLPAPTVASDATNKAYVDAAITGLSWKNTVHVISTSNGTLATAFAAGQTVDGHVLTAGDRILLAGQTTTSENGIYVVQASGAPVRSTDGATFAELDHASVFVQNGTTYHDTAWVQGTELSSFSGQVWTQFGSGSVYTAGVGLDLTGNTFTVKLGASIAQLPTNEVGIDVYTGGGLMNTVDGTASSTLTNAQLSLTKVGTAGTYTSITTDAYGRVTAGSNPAPSFTGFPYDITGSCFGVPTASQVDIRFSTGRAFTIPANLAGSVVKSGTAATASTAILVQKNGATVATITFAAAGTTATFSTQAAVSYAIGDKFSIVGASTADATLADIDYFILATLA